MRLRCQPTALKAALSTMTRCILPMWPRKWKRATRACATYTIRTGRLGFSRLALAMRAHLVRGARDNCQNMCCA